MRFVVHDQSGNILRYGNCDDDDLLLQAGAGETVLPLLQEVDPAKHMISEGIIIDKPSSTVSAVLWASVRYQRNALLASSDWTQMPDVRMDQSRKEEWAAYRQALRDITSNTDDPGTIAWPTRPGLSL